MQVFVARQAIFDRSKQVAAYELLYRSAEDASTAGRSDSMASFHVLTGSFVDIGLDRLLCGRRGLLNVPERLLLDERLYTLPKELIGLEIMETVSTSAEVLEACRSLRKHGYQLVLDDYAGAERMSPLVDLVDWVKVDFRQISLERAAALSAELARRGKALLAEKVETEEEFQVALHSGYSYFQGFFLQRPSVFHGHSISSNAARKLRLISLLTRPELNFLELESLIAEDVGLCYKLLQYNNSARFGTRQQLRSIRECLMRLGGEELRRWMSLVLLPQLSARINPELLATTMIRARMCERLAVLAGRQDLQNEAFLAGMLSLLDAILGVPMPQILERLGVEGDLAEAVLVTEASSKPLSVILAGVKSYEGAYWSELAAVAGLLSLSASVMSEAYVESVEWSQQLH